MSAIHPTRRIDLTIRNSRLLFQEQDGYFLFFMFRIATVRRPAADGSDQERCGASRPSLDREACGTDQDSRLRWRNQAASGDFPYGATGDKCPPLSRGPDGAEVCRISRPEHLSGRCQPFCGQ